MQHTVKNKNIVLGVCGGMAAYKSVELLRILKNHGANVRVIMTQSAMEFVGRLTFEALSGSPVCTSIFEKNDYASIRHIDWAREADAVVIAPATANITGKLANGIADDMLSTFMLAVKSPVIFCPSMNADMYESKAVQRNLETLRADGYFIMEPGTGKLACGATGPGRLPEPADIFDRILSSLTPKDLKGKRILVTAGPTRELIDPVRFISNPSSGKMGYSIAKAAEHRGGKVVLITGPVNLPDPLNVNMIYVRTAEEMASAVFKHMKRSDIIIKSAAVSDYRPVTSLKRKIKKGKEKRVLALQKNQDILKELGRKKENRILAGFAAETENLEKNAKKKLAEKNLDIIVGNFVGRSSSGFGTDTNKVTLFYKDGSKESLPKMEKDVLAHILLDRIVKLMNS
ncbi:MAG: bifunctional phosphopantothenoylcysteine decarboxylase/phosphopantothenate--cysteine ligase CoaBC [Thermodesulfobacteriota bacterium]|nr:bifunctional phosphopantothenoylcysteine decarboxylase/phosphopantothenate--cysteine ligase CoaBC [Thermodesulfobacteriota bacterium]